MSPPAKPIINGTDVVLRAVAGLCGSAALAAVIMVANVWKDVSLLTAENDTQAAEIRSLKETIAQHEASEQRLAETMAAERQAAAVAGARFETTLNGFKEVLNELLRSLRRRG